MPIRTLSTPLLQILCKIILNWQVIGNEIIDPDDKFLKYFLSFYGLNTFEIQQPKGTWTFKSIFWKNDQSVNFICCAKQMFSTSCSIFL